MLAHVGAIDADITVIEELIAPLAQAVTRLDEIEEVGRSILVIVWHLLSDETATFSDLGSTYYDTRGGTQRAIPSQGNNHPGSARSYRLPTHTSFSD
jgi:hypothetical protein